MVLAATEIAPYASIVAMLSTVAFTCSSKMPRSSASETAFPPLPQRLRVPVVKVWYCCEKLAPTLTAAPDSITAVLPTVAVTMSCEIKIVNAPANSHDEVLPLEAGAP